MKTRVIISADSAGLSVDAYYLDDDAGKLVDFDFNKDEACALLAKILSQSIFAFTCLPPSSIKPGALQWKSNNPSLSKSSDDGTDERVHSSSAE